MKNKFVDFKVLATSLCCSVVMGLISFAFLKCLDYAADFRSFFPLCYLFLPVAGIVTAFVYKRVGGKSSMGNNIIIESANDGEKVPKRLASLTFIFTCITHLFGGSVGREGTAVQIGGSLTSNVADYLGFKNNDRSTIVLSGISSAFGSVFGTPFAGAFFGMEVCCVGRLSAGAVIPCFACSYLANFVTQLLGFKHERYAISSIPDFDARFLFVFLIAAVCLGLIGKLFALGIKYVKLAYSKIFKNYLLAAAVGAAIVSLLIFALGLNNFEGLSTWMQDTAFKGDAKWYDMPAKYLLPTAFKCPHCGSREFLKEKDIMDVWFDSGITHRAVVEKRSNELGHLPVEMYLEGSDQHRGWFQSSLLTAVATTGRAPYLTVLTHGFVLDGEGRKMSTNFDYAGVDDEFVENYVANKNLKIKDVVLMTLDADRVFLQPQKGKFIAENVEISPKTALNGGSLNGDNA